MQSRGGYNALGRKMGFIRGYGSGRKWVRGTVTKDFPPSVSNRLRQKIPLFLEFAVPSGRAV